MDWTGEGMLLSARPHGENAAVIEVFTPDHGRHAGLVRGGTGRRLKPVLQPGAQLHLVWRARLGDHLGQFTVEPLQARAPGLMADPDALAALASICGLLRFALPERDPHPRLYDLTLALLDGLALRDGWFGAYLAWERLLLDEAGYGLDLSVCALTGTREGLAYVSPRTGRAVSADAAGDWAPRLLPLPALLRDPAVQPADARAQMAAGLRVTGHFLTQLLAPVLERPVPQARDRLAARFGGGEG